MLRSLQFPSTEQKVFGGLALWAIAMTLASVLGLLTRLPLPSIALFVIASFAILLLLYYRNPSVTQYVASLNPRHLVLFHLWRIVAGLAFLHYGSQSLLPERFVINAGYGDLAVGFLVPIVLLSHRTTAQYIAFHLFGLLDFVVAVGTGLIFTLLQIPLMENIAAFPIVLIPLFGVPLTGASSIMAIDALLHHQTRTAVK